MSEIALFQCPPGCLPGQCDSDGPWVEGRWSCAHCYGTGKKHDDNYQQTDEVCPRCGGDGLGGGYGTATCSKCGEAAIDRALWEGP